MHVVWSFDYRAAGEYQTDALIVTAVDDSGTAIAELRRLVDDDESLHIETMRRLGPLLNEPVPRLHRPDRSAA